MVLNGAKGDRTIEPLFFLINWNKFAPDLLCRSLHHRRILTLERTRGAITPHSPPLPQGFLTFFLDDKTSAPEVFCM